MRGVSEEALFIARNWETVEDILTATQRLRDELATVARSAVQSLADRSWWSEGWELKTSGQSQAYMYREHWVADSIAALWVGIEQFTPESVFGAASPPLLYVWRPAAFSALGQELAAALDAGGHVVIGELDSRPTSGYMVRHYVQKCLPEELDGFAERATGQIVEFMEHYAKVLMRLDDVIRRHVR